MSTPGQALVSVALLSEIVKGGQAFLMPIGFTSVQRVPLKQSDVEVTTHGKRRKSLFAANYFSDDDQWGEDAGQWYEESPFSFNSNGEETTEQQQQFYEGSKRAILGGAALGTAMAINSAVGMSAGAEPSFTEAVTAAVPQQQQEQFASVESSYSAVVNTQPEVTLPYLEKQIQAAEEAVYSSAAASYEAPAASQALASTYSSYESSASVVANAEAAAPKAASTAAASATTNTASLSPSFVRYTQEHMPGWIETGHKVYDAAAPKIVAGSQKLWAEVDKQVTPKIVAKEHEILGDTNSAILDQTLSNVAYAGKMVAGMVGKAVSFGIQGGVQVAKATPEVIKVGKQVYDTVDKKIIPEVVDTSRKMKTIVDKTVPEVMDASKHAYDTIMPEVMSAERQVASTVKTGVDMAMPTVMEIEKKVMPVLTNLEHDVLGDEGAYQFEKTIADAAKQGHNTFKSVGNTIPQVVASGQKTVDSVAYTGRTVAKAVPLIMESGKNAYESADRSVHEAIATTQDIASDIDRAAGKTAYALENNVFDATKIIDKAVPALLETGRVAATTGVEIARTVETGGKAIIQDVSGFVDDVTIDTKIESAAKRFAATKPVAYRDFTASVNDPNNLGKL